MAAKISKIRDTKIIEMYIELEPTEPRVWRRFLVNDSMSMYQLHEIIQVTMGWMHSHLFMFMNKGVVIAESSPDADWGDDEFKDARKTKISSIFNNPGDTVIYQYDFGDSWAHKIRFDRVVDKDEVMFGVPRCIGGENACPPEDCGGFPGFQSLKEIIADPDHEEYDSMIRWLDGYYPNYDHKEFSLSAVNKILKIGASKFLRIAPKFYE